MVGYSRPAGSLIQDDYDCSEIYVHINYNYIKFTLGNLNYIHTSPSCYSFFFNSFAHQFIYYYYYKISKILIWEACNVFILSEII